MESEIDRNAKIIWDYMLMHHELKPRDAIFGLGTSDIQVAHRAAQLFLEGYGELLIFAGNSGEVHGKAPVFDKPEAEVFADIAIEMGVPADKIIIENKSTNTGENILFTKKLLLEKDLHLNSFILVQKPTMERRTYATFRKQWPEAECVVTSPQFSYEEYVGGIQEKNFIINVMVGDLQRIREYPAKGFQIPQEIPDEVWGAYNKLISLGYTNYVILT